MAATASSYEEAGDVGELMELLEAVAQVVLPQGSVVSALRLPR